jgi:hypothetical protein
VSQEHPRQTEGAVFLALIVADENTVAGDVYAEPRSMSLEAWWWCEGEIKVILAG